MWPHTSSRLHLQHSSGCAYVWEGNVTVVNTIRTHTLHHAITGLHGFMAPHVQVQVLANTPHTPLYHQSGVSATFEGYEKKNIFSEMALGLCTLRLAGFFLYRRIHT
jgi:hypothetical protein